MSSHYLLNISNVIVGEYKNKKCINYAQESTIVIVEIVLAFKCLT